MPCRSTFPILALLAALLLLGPVLSGPLFAQSEQERARQLARTDEKEEKLYGLEPELGEDAGEEITQELIFDAGGFFRYSHFDFDDGEATHTMRLTDLRIWSNMVYKDIHQLYARVKGELIDYNAGTQYSYMEENDQNYPRLDVGYYQTDISRLVDLGLRRLRFKGGRDYYRVGEGMVLDRRGDGGLLEFREADFSLSGFIMGTVVSEDQFDRTHPDFTHDRRMFSGFEGGYEIAREVELFGYMVWQRNKNRQDYAIAPGQKFGHDSYYRGVGVRGEIGPSLNYFGEFAKEAGTHYSSGTVEHADVDAFAFNSQVDYTFRAVTTQPKISIQYLHASGDRDAGNTSDTIGGNMAGTDYDAFTSFGYVNTGVVFFPRLSNLEMYRAGVTFMPFESHETMGDLELGVSAFVFKRPERKGGTSDRFSTIPGDSHLGKEVDLHAIWRPFSDVSVMVQYGIFRPDQDVFNILGDGLRHYFSVGTTVYF